jgi:muramidase (phage lysozyme)
MQRLDQETSQIAWPTQGGEGAVLGLRGHGRGATAMLLGAGLALSFLTFCNTGSARADQPRAGSVDVRVKFTQSARRDHIMSVLATRGVDPALLRQKDGVPIDKGRKAKISFSADEQMGSDPQLSRLFNLIASAEAGSAGYDAIHYRATVLPDAPPSTLTIAEILDWIAATPRQNHAIGRYQIIPMTLNYLIAAENVPTTAVFTPALQDRLATRLVEDAGLEEFRSGALSPEDFMDSLAFVWAGLPLGSGRSAYHGIAGNKATITRDRYKSEFVAIFGLGAVQIALSDE